MDPFGAGVNANLNVNLDINETIKNVKKSREKAKVDKFRIKYKRYIDNYYLVVINSYVVGELVKIGVKEFDPNLLKSPSVDETVDKFIFAPYYHLTDTRYGEKLGDIRSGNTDKMVIGENKQLHVDITKIPKYKEDTAICLVKQDTNIGFKSQSLAKKYVETLMLNIPKGYQQPDDPVMCTRVVVKKVGDGMLYGFKVKGKPNQPIIKK